MCLLGELIRYYKKPLYYKVYRFYLAVAEIWRMSSKYGKIIIVAAILNIQVANNKFSTVDLKHPLDGKKSFILRFLFDVTVWLMTSSIILTIFVNNLLLSMVLSSLGEKCCLVWGGIAVMENVDFDLLNQIYRIWVFDLCIEMDQ